MTRFRSTTAFTAVLLTLCMSFMLASCGGSLASLAKAEADITAGCTTGYTIVSQGVTSGLISQSDGIAIMNVLLQIELANKQAITATAAVNTLNSTNSASLLSIIT